ncbi:MAG TPA: FHA domain-containing protein [Candidatus Anoxymicrobiaceae bacterium]|jgi:pSer/pThr/pTyr-binding forkhead associated (FHA) protein
MDSPSEDSHAVLECTSEPGVILKVSAGDVIGREGDIDLAKLKDAEYLSRKHARFSRKAGKWSIENLSTKSFTYVNGKQVPPDTDVEIEPGDRLTFGIIRCTFREG